MNGEYQFEYQIEPILRYFLVICNNHSMMVVISIFIIPKSSEEYVKDGGNETTNHYKNLENVWADWLRTDNKVFKPKDRGWFLAKFFVTIHFFWNLLLNF